MADGEFRYKTVVDLKAYLKERGITTSDYSKAALVRLCQAAKELNLNPGEEDDYKDLSLYRRTVVGTDGKEITLPDISTINLPSWLKDLSVLPSIEMGDIMVYLVTVCQWDTERLRRYKDDKSFKLFEQNHVDNVRLFPVPNSDFMYIKATCVPETRQHDEPYTCWLLVDGKGFIKSGGCTCVADDGSCKHCLALLFSLNSFIERHKDRGVEVGTDRQCEWDKPRQASNPTTVKDLKSKKKGDVCDEFRPISNAVGMRKDNVNLSLINTCKSHGSVFLHTLDCSSDEEDDVIIYPNFQEILSGAPINLNDDEFLKYLCNAHTNEYISYVESKTKEQAESDDWFEHRKGRITASIMGNVLNCNMDKLGPNNYKVKKIYSTNQVTFSTAATDYGKAMESVALSQYRVLYEGEHAEVDISKSGFFISGEFPFIGATPDAIVECKCCGTGIVEIKCSHSFQNKTPFEVASENDYHVQFQDGKVKLKYSSPWYAQVQTQLYATKRNWCDFVFFTRKGLVVDRIFFSENYFSKCLSKAKLFFFKFLKNGKKS